ncbi:MAG: head-tail adaptor protein [Phenylobacterium sp.]|nr:head-tail adaptor protein [Phenylobacterium sp.]
MAGRSYDRVVVFLRATTVRTGPLKEATETWAPLTRVYASRTGVSDGERDRAAQVGAFRTDRFETWWTPKLADLSPEDRLECEGVTFDITGVKELGYRQRIEVTAKARADAA